VANRSRLALAHPAGDSAVKSGVSSIISSWYTRPVMLSPTTIRKPDSAGDASTILASTPATRSASMVCGNWPRAFG
jgi:hypothetical protein